MPVQIQLRHDTAANWTSADPTLALGELGAETDTGKFKVGDGTTAWTSLAYSVGGNTVIVADEGTPLATAADTLDFVGAGVTASGVGATKTITIPGVADILDLATVETTATKVLAPDGAGGVEFRAEAGLADQGVITYLDGTVAAAPATPAAGKLRVYAKTGPALAVKDDAGNETVLGAGGGSVATDAIWDATGDLAVGSGANTAAKLTMGSALQVLRVNAAGTALEYAALPGGGSVLPLDDVAAGSGDLFGGTSLDGGWTSLQTTAVTTVDRSVDGYLILKNSGNTSAQERGLQRSFSPAGDFEVSCKISGTVENANYQWAGLFAGAADPSDGGSGNRIQTMIVYNGGIVRWKMAKMAAGSETAVFEETAPIAGPYVPVWLALRRVGSTLSGGISFDGVQYAWHATTTTIAFSVATCGLFLAETSATTDLRTSFSFIATTG